MSARIQLVDQRADARLLTWERVDEIVEQLGSGTAWTEVGGGRRSWVEHQGPKPGFTWGAGGILTRPQQRSDLVNQSSVARKP